MASFEPKPFGKYFLIEKIAVGGMAEIYKAKTFGVDGFEKLLAIKKILSHYSSDKEFIAMLTDEAKLVVRLSHTNIVQIYDLGKVGDDYYISMEYIDGVNLREINHRSKELKETIPLPLCLYITSEICKGLDYAHSKRDEKGQPLEIVHRDISPQNVLLSYEGETKIVDFGIAKAALNISHTTVGILKGKITYMSPEQALGKPVHGTTDMFSCGLLLFEMITGERFFTGDSQFEILEKIRNTKITQELLKERGIPEEVCPILAKALAYNVKERYETAGDFQIALTKMLYTNYTDFSPKQLSNLIKKWFSPEIKAKKKQTINETSIDSHTKSILLEGQGQQSLVQTSSHSDKPNENTPPPILQDTTKPEDSIRSEDLLHGNDTLTDEHPKFEDDDSSNSNNNDDEEHSDHTVSQPSLSSHIRAQEKRRSLWPVLLLLLLVFGGGALYQFTDLKNIISGLVEKEDTGVLEIQSDPPGALVILDGEEKGETPLTIKDIVLNQEYEVRLDKEGFEEEARAVKVEGKDPVKLNFKLTPSEDDPASKKLTWRIETEPKGAEVFLNSESTNLKTPATIKNLEPGKSYQLKLVQEGFKDFEQTLELKKDQTEIEGLQIELEKVMLGSILVKSDPSGAEIFLNDKETGLSTPNTLKDLAIDQTYKITLKKKEHESGTKEIKVTNDKPVYTNFKLKPDVVLTTLNIAPKDISGAKIYIENEFKGLTPNSFKLEPGTYTLRIRKDGYESLTEKITVVSGQTFNFDSPLVSTSPSKAQKQAQLSVTSSPSGARVIINHKSYGNTPLHLELDPGKVTVSLSKSGYQDYRQTVTLTSGKTRKVAANLQRQSSNPTPPTPPTPPAPPQPPISGSGSVRIDSNPRGAAVIFDGHKAGITPVVVPNVSGQGTHSITVTLPGYKTWSRSFTMSKKYVEFSAQLRRE